MEPPTIAEITKALGDERPDVMDQPYHRCGMHDRGLCDEWNTVVLRFAGMLFPVAQYGLTRRQRWINYLVAGEIDEAIQMTDADEDDIPF